MGGCYTTSVSCERCVKIRFREFAARYKSSLKREQNSHLFSFKNPTPCVIEINSFTIVLARMRTSLSILLKCALLGSLVAQEEAHLPEYLVFMKQFVVDIQIREPSGIMIWTRNNPLIEMFGLELYVGRSNHSHQEPHWDRELFVNTSTIVDGKFLIRDEHMVVEKGDTIRYRFSVLHKKTLSHSNFRRIVVTDHLFYRPKNNYCFSQCLAGDQELDHEEVAHLKNILEEKIMQCVETQTSKYLFFPLENAANLVSNSDLYVKSRLWNVDALKPLVNNVISTYLAPNGVGFQMYTIIDKFKVLELETYPTAMVRCLHRVILMVMMFRLSHAGLMDWFRGDDVEEERGHKVGKIYVEVLSPKGIRLWTAYNPDTELLGVELYVKYFGGRTEALECALCKNTTEPVDGKFMLEHPNLVARFGDVLQYTIITFDGVTTKRHAVRRMFVREELIKPSDQCVCPGRELPGALRAAPSAEVDLLERMILRALGNRSRDCESISNWLVLRAEPRNEQADLLEYVRTYLDLLLLRVKWRTLDAGGSGWTSVRPSALVVEAEDHVDGIAFQVRSTIEKLKMLDLMSFSGVVGDFDGVL
uniref:CBM39 domain-containing protein n=1 Tax=Anopheles minimus TaxID=112268 RepID=A0A182WGZ5_9DIPT